MGQYGGIQRPSRRDDQMPMGGFGPESLAGQEQYIPVPPGQPVGIATNGMPTPNFDSPSTPFQTFQPGTITEDQMRFTGQPVLQIAREPGTPEPPRMFTDQLTGKQVTQAEVDSLGGMQTFLDPNAERARARGLGRLTNQKLNEAQLRAQPTDMSAGGGLGMQGIPQMGTAGRSAGTDGGMGGISSRFNQPQQRGGMFNQPQQRGGMFNQQNQFGGQQGQQGMQQMMQFMQQMMQMFSMMGGQNRSPYGGGGYQRPQMQRMMPQQQYQKPQMQYQRPQMQYQPPQMQQQMQRQPQQPSPFAQSIRPRY